MPDQDPSNDPSQPNEAIPLNYQSSRSSPKPKQFSTLRVIGMLLLILLLVGLLAFGICTWSILKNA